MASKEKKNGNNKEKDKCKDCKGSGKTLEGGPHIKGIKPLKNCCKCGGTGITKPINLSTAPETK